MWLQFKPKTRRGPRKRTAKRIPGHPRLTEANVLLMREMHAAGTWEGYTVTFKALAEWFFTTEGTAMRVVKRRSWKHI